MTDQNPNPATIDPNTNDESFDIFGGSDDIFENSTILEPINDALDWEEDNKVETEDLFIDTQEPETKMKLMSIKNLPLKR